MSDYERRKRRNEMLFKAFLFPLIIAVIALTSSLCVALCCESSDFYNKTDTYAAATESIVGQTAMQPPEAGFQTEHVSEIGTQTVSVSQPKQQPDASTFEIYFLDVGQGDSAVVLCDGAAMLIDGGVSKMSSLIFSFLKSHDIDHLDYIVASHTDADHVGGLSGALNYASVGTALCTAAQHDSEPFQDFVKYLSKQDVQITVPDAGDTYSLGSASFTVLYPAAGEILSDNTSIIIRMIYGETSFLFVGDAELEDEEKLLASGSNISATVLKVGHHGSRSSSSEQFIRKVAPEYAVISVGAQNSYGHPSDEVLDRFRAANVTVFRTDMHGDIHCTSDGMTVTFDTEKSGNSTNSITAQSTDSITAQSVIPDGTTYILNTNSHKFHYTYCPSVELMKESNKEYSSETREEIIAKGYQPCGRCHP